MSLIPQSQLEQYATEINDRINIPWIGEKLEQRVFELGLNQLNNQLASGVEARFGPEFKESLTKVLDPETTAQVRASLAGTLLSKIVENNLVDIINQRIDVPGLNEEQEAGLIRQFSAVVVETVLCKLYLQLD